MSWWAICSSAATSSSRACDARQGSERPSLAEEGEVFAVRGPGRAQATQLVERAKTLGLRPNQVAARFLYSGIVAEAGEIVGWSRTEARARWREASAFAHGRTWPSLQLSELELAERIRGGYMVTLTLAEAHHEKLAPLARHHSRPANARQWLATPDGSDHSAGR